MIDTHCHLTYPPLLDHLDEVLKRAADVGVRHLITIGTRVGDSLKCVELATHHPQISCAVGIHPHHAAEVTKEELKQVVALFAHPHVAAAGEMGLDYHYDFSPRDEQRRVFEFQLAAAQSAGKPLVLHSRESIDDCLAVLRNAGATRAVFHCFTGTMLEAKKILNAGYSLGFTGIITFKNTQYLRDIVEIVPADRLLLETDAPYLSPEPMRRQKHNEPALVVHVYRLAARLRGVHVDELARQVVNNSQKLFSIHCHN